nr:NADP-dependent phosphogluconate dehydrogenase [Ardenticatena sp.]
MSRSEIAILGLGTMGAALARNIARNGFRLSVYNRHADKTRHFLDIYGAPNIQGAFSLEELVAQLERPRRLMLMVPAGNPVDAVIAQVCPLLDRGDIIIDGGNSHYTDTERRQSELANDGILLLGTGVSGGEAGALWGPSIMPGGPRAAYEAVAPIFEAIAAKAPDGQPCVTYLGDGGSGHYVKMVHNGIEYAIMQAIAEVYDLLTRVGGMSPLQQSAVFAEWNRAELAAFLVEITAHILATTDPDTGHPIVEVILDKAKQKGTGKWTSQEALDVGVAVPSITEAVEARILSGLKEERVLAAEHLAGPRPTPNEADGHRLVPTTRDALYAAMVVAFAQGMALLDRARTEHGYTYDLGDVAAIWRAGCIIRAALLEDIRAAYADEPTLVNLLLAPTFREALAERQHTWRETVHIAIRHGVPVPVLAASLAYYDGYRSEWLPANLIQAQRDYFGTHTFERVDEPGSFHFEWA